MTLPVDFRKLSAWLIAGAVPLTVSWGTFVTTAVLRTESEVAHHARRLEQLRETEEIVSNLRADIRALQAVLQSARRDFCLERKDETQ